MQYIFPNVFTSQPVLFSAAVTAHRRARESSLKGVWVLFPFDLSEACLNMNGSEKQNMKIGERKKEKGRLYRGKEGGKGKGWDRGGMEERREDGEEGRRERERKEERDGVWEDKKGGREGERKRWKERRKGEVGGKEER